MTNQFAGLGALLRAKEAAVEKQKEEKRQRRKAQCLIAGQYDETVMKVLALLHTEAYSEQTQRSDGTQWYLGTQHEFQDRGRYYSRWDKVVEVALLFDERNQATSFAVTVSGGRGTNGEVDQKRSSCDLNEGALIETLRSLYGLETR